MQRRGHGAGATDLLGEMEREREREREREEGRERENRERGGRETERKRGRQEVDKETDRLKSVSCNSQIVMFRLCMVSHSINTIKHASLWNAESDVCFYPGKFLQYDWRVPLFLFLHFFLFLFFLLFLFVKRGGFRTSLF